LSYKRDTQAVAEKLVEDGYNAAALHGFISSATRWCYEIFRGRQIQMLVATDVARGIDVDNTRSKLPTS
jgi:ATP-dependent RNA helicase DeaD